VGWGIFLNKKPTMFYLLETLKKSNLGKKDGIYLGVGPTQNKKLQ
jgi:hypothetical protein